MYIPTPTLPFIGQFSSTVQISILSALIVLSYLHRGARYLTLAIIGAYYGFKIIVPIVHWTYYLFKGVAMFGFYIHYFQIGIGFLLTGLGFLGKFGDGLDTLLKEVEKLDRRRAGAADDDES